MRITTSSRFGPPGPIVNLIEPSVMLITQLAEWFGTAPTPEFEQFVMSHLGVIKRMWQRKTVGVGPSKVFTASSEIGTNLRWFYLPKNQVGVFKDGDMVWVQGSEGDFWGWDGRIYSPSITQGEKPFPLHGDIVDQIEWGRTDLMRLVPRTLSRRTERHGQIGFSADMATIRCEDGMAYYVDAERFLAAVRIMDPILNVGRCGTKDGVYLRVWDRYRVWIAPMTAPGVVT